MRTEHQQRIDDFMRLAGQALPEDPALPSKEILLLRAKLILEEALETIDALGFHMMPLGDLQPNEKPADLVLAIDGCADLSVVTIGTLSALGVDDEPVLRLVDANNLAKFGIGGHRREDGKWVKPENHKPPDIEAEIRRQTPTKKDDPTKCPQCGAQLTDANKTHIGGRDWCSGKCWREMMNSLSNEQSLNEFYKNNPGV